MTYIPEKELGTGELQYGAFIFPIAILAKASSEFTQDSTHRVTKYVKHKLTFETVLFPGVDEDLHVSPGEVFFPTTATSTDVGLAAARRILGTRGLALRFIDKGFGLVNIDTVQQDVLAGPEPKILAWEPLGNNYSVRVVWSVEVTLAVCDPYFVDQKSKFTEFNYDIGWSIDIAGLTTRTITGHWEIVLNLADNILLNNADQLRDLISFPIPMAFGRITQNYRLNARRDRVDFTIVDREYEADDKNPYHDGVVLNDIRQTSTTLESILTNQWLTTIHGSITVAKNKPRVLAWIAFLHVVKGRLDHAISNAQIPGAEETSPGDEEPDEAGLPKPIIIPGKLTITEQIYGRAMSFSFSWIMFTTLKTFLNAAGFWQPVGGASPQTQRTSLLAPNQAWTQRGAKQLSQPGGETIIHLCGPQATLTSTDLATVRQTVDDDAEIFSCTKPDPGQSWISFSPTIQNQVNTNAYVSYPASGSSRPTVPAFNLDTVTANRMPSGAGSGGTSQGAYIPPTIHRSTPRSALIVFFGSAVRLGYPIPEIQLLSVGGADVIEVTQKGKQTYPPPVSIGGCDLFKSDFKRYYVFASADIGQGNEITTNPSVKQVNIVPLDLRPW